MSLLILIEVFINIKMTIELISTMRKNTKKYPSILFTFTQTMPLKTEFKGVDCIKSYIVN